MSGRTPASPGRAEAPARWPLSFAQERLWFLDQLDPCRSAYNIALTVSLRGRLDRTALAGALSEVVRRHHVLRTRFVIERGQPAAVVEREAALDLPLVDLSGQPAGQQAIELEGRLQQEAARPFALDRGPLLRGRLFRLHDHDHRLALTAHHIAVDGWSMGIVLREMAAHYSDRVEGRPFGLPEPPLQYHEHAEQERAGADAPADLDYWSDRLSGAPLELDLPADRARPPVPSGRGESMPFLLGERLLADLRRLARSERATLFMTLLGAFEVLLFRYTGRTDMLLGTPVANRDGSELEHVVGCFVNTIVLRALLERDLSFRQLLSRIRGTTLDDFEHAGLPFERLVEALRPRRDLSRSPVFQVMFALHNEPSDELRMTGLEVRSEAIDTGGSRFDLTLGLAPSAAGLRGRLEYATDLFDHDRMLRLIGHYRTLLEASVSDPDRPIGRLPILLPQERRLLIAGSSDGARRRAAPGRALHVLFEEQSGRRPDAVAVSGGPAGAALSYRDVADATDRLARRLARLGAPGDRVGILVGRRPGLLTAALAVLRAGRVCLPLDAARPERLHGMLSSAGVRALLCDTEPAGLGGVDLPLVLVSEQGDATPADLPVVRPEQEAAAFLGQDAAGPVLRSHAALSALASALAERIGLTPADRLVAGLPPASEAGFLELLVPCVTGAELVLEPHREPAAPMEAWELLLRAGEEASPLTVVTRPGPGGRSPGWS